MSSSIFVTPANPVKSAPSRLPLPLPASPPSPKVRTASLLSVIAQIQQKFQLFSVIFCHLHFPLPFPLPLRYKLSHGNAPFPFRL